MRLSLLAGAIASAVFSGPCPGCGRGGLGGRLCAGCRQRLPRIDPARACATCGLPLAEGGAGLVAGTRCGDCLGGRAFDRARALGPLAGALHDHVVALKYGGRRALAFDLGREAAGALRGELPDVDLVVPVPLGRRRRRERGYNQASEIAAGVATALARPCRPGALRRARETRPQTTLARTARRENVRDAFRARLPPGATRVLLVDDVVTTGATIEEASRALRRAGAVEVVVLSLARVTRGPATPRVGPGAIGIGPASHP